MFWNDCITFRSASVIIKKIFSFSEKTPVPIPGIHGIIAEVRKTAAIRQPPGPAGTCRADGRDLKLELLYQDRRIVVCLKPAGVCSTDEPGGMPELLRAALGLGSDGCVRSVHRLDRPVGGLMVYARSRAAASVLSGQVRAGQMEKQYLAVLEGEAPAEAGELRDWLARDTAARRTFAVPGPSKQARQAVLRYRLLARAGGRSLVLVTLLTGRTHQIRAQFSSRGLPLAGDRKYGAPEGGSIALWSCRLRFFHPETNVPMDFFRRPPGEGVWASFPAEAFARAEQLPPDAEC